MTFDEFKKLYLQIAELDGVKVTEDELVKLFISQLVINTFENRQLKKLGKSRG